MSNRNLAWTATSALATLAAGFVAQQAVKTTWKAVTGTGVPADEDLLDDNLVSIIVFAAVSGAVASVARQLTLRKAATWYGGADVNPLRPLLDAAPALDEVTI